MHSQSVANLPLRILAVATRSFLALTPLLALTSCTVVDKEYPTLLPMAETNPLEDAVVGMWHRKSSQGEFQWRMNILFQRDGTGLVESHFNDTTFLGSGEQTGFDKMAAFTWKYQGAGIWTLTSVTDPSRVDECRLAGGKLLRFIKYWSDEGGSGSFVYTPIRP